MLQTGKFPAKYLAFDTSTDVMSIALTDGSQTWQHVGPGGAKASITLIPSILALLAEAGMALGDLQAIAFGRGPGSFTGLRTACAVAQGLAFGANQGAGIPVLPIDTLMAVAEEARLQSQSPVLQTATQPEVELLRAVQMGSSASAAVALTSNPLLVKEGAINITALLDARMDEMYVQRYASIQGVLTTLGGCQLIRPEHLMAELNTLYAGNVFEVYRSRLPDGLNSVTCLPTATAMLRLAPRLAASGHCVPADQALPLYVRDKVAQTTQEREQIKALKLKTLSSS